MEDKNGRPKETFQAQEVHNASRPQIWSSLSNFKKGGEDNVVRLAKN